MFVTKIDENSLQCTKLANSMDDRRHNRNRTRRTIVGARDARSTLNPKRGSNVSINVP